MSCPMKVATQKPQPVQPVTVAAAKAWPWEKDTSARDTDPTWDHDILPLLVAPPWLREKRADGSLVPESLNDRPRKIGAWWQNQCANFGTPPFRDGSSYDIQSYEQVKATAEVFHQQLASRSMPITDDESQYWPEWALDTLRLWINQGCRRLHTDVIVLRHPPIKPSTAAKFRTRKDVRNLTPKEVQTYRAKIDDILQPQNLQSLHQKMGELHGYWCLHYQEASFPWHRCWVKLLEHVIDFPIPYWNFFALDTADPDSPHAGFPQIFRDETYQHPDGTTRRNPLKYALAWQGKSRDGTSKWIQRNPVLQNGRPAEPGPERNEWDRFIAMVPRLHDDFIRAFNVPFFSSPQGFGVPWQNIQILDTTMPDNLYASQQSMDGWFEQAHDQVHGWIGGDHGDMSDNVYTAYDPIFYSYHCNIDRLFEHYLRTTPNLQFSVRFPLRPFTKGAMELDYENPHHWTYSSIGDVVQDTKSMGYQYAPPACKDVFDFAAPKDHPLPGPVGGSPMNLVSSAQVKLAMKTQTDVKKTPWILFKGVGCTEYSYRIDIFLKDAASTEPDLVKNPDYVGRLFRMGMGVPHDPALAPTNGRCRQDTVTRAIDAERVADRIGDGFMQIVTKLNNTGGAGPELVPEEEWKTLPGFVGELVWIAE